MTRVLFVPDEQTFVLLDSPLPPAGLVEAVRRGAWQPPAPYLTGGPPLWAFQQGRLVIVVAVLPSAGQPPAAEEIALSPRQREVLQGLAEGLTTSQIALRLGLHPNTVALHVARIKAALGTSTRAQTVGKAAALGLCRPDRQ